MVENASNLTLRSAPLAPGKPGRHHAMTHERLAPPGAQPLDRPAAIATERFLTIWDKPRTAADGRARQRRTRRLPRFYL